MPIMRPSRREVLLAAGAALCAAAANAQTPAPRLVAGGVQGPEGPTAMADGSVVMVAFVPGDVIRIWPDGRKAVVSSPGAGVVGTVLGHDGQIYAAKLDPREFRPNGRAVVEGGTAGGIFRIDPDTGRTALVYGEVGGEPLRGANDLVIDRWGELWFTDVVNRAVYWARTDGSAARRVVAGQGVNGITLSPDGRTLYVAPEGKILGYDLAGRGDLAAAPRVAFDLPPGLHVPDGMKTDADGNLVLGCWEDGVVTVSPAGRVISQFKWPGLRVINLVFGGADRRTLNLAAVQGEGMGGGLYALPWTVAGAKLF